MIFCARATRGRRLPSLDARSGRSICPHPRRITSEVGGWRQKEGRVAWPSSCSRNAHDQNVLVRRAQSRIDHATLELELGSRRCAQWKIWEMLEV